MPKQEKPTKKDLSEVHHFVDQYAIKRPLHEEFTNKLAELLKALLKIGGIDIQLIESRTKDTESFKEKISRSSKMYVDPFKEVTDLSGIRIIVYYDEDLDKVCQLIEHEFEIDRANSVDKRTILRPEEFGYQSIHFVVKLSDSRCGLLEWRHLAGLQAEIQVRTVLQHAWAAISHKLQYKREGDVPQELRRRLFRLSALLELADEEFMALRNRTAALTQSIEQQLSEGETNLEINLLTVEEFLRTSSEVEQLLTHAAKSGFSFEDYRLEGESETTSDFVVICKKIGLENIASLKTVIHESLNWSQAYLRSQKKVSSSKWEVSPAFICILILIRRFHEQFKVEDLVNLDWDKGIASRILRVAKEKK